VKASKRFFFEKKKQKTFACWGVWEVLCLQPKCAGVAADPWIAVFVGTTVGWGTGRDAATAQFIKVFLLLFFQKKKRLLVFGDA
jgi:hypothetical protein